MARKLEIAANVAIIVVAVIASIVLVRNYMARGAVKMTREQIATGNKLPMPGVEWQANGNTVVLALSTNCHYCSESAPFYKRLTAELSRRRAHLMIVMPQSIEEGRKYVEGLGLQAADVRQVPLRALKIRGTPTLAIVDGDGVVRNVWEGMLQPEREQEVMEAVRDVPAAAAVAQR
ncbi:MAG TPA: hypothetical protein VGF69_06860 [Thermoanaerobaculia bacterium]|jgi:hypothetical protein